METHETNLGELIGMTSDDLLLRAQKIRESLAKAKQGKSSQSVATLFFPTSGLVDDDETSCDSSALESKNDASKATAPTATSTDLSAVYTTEGPTVTSSRNEDEDDCSDSNCYGGDALNRDSDSSDSASEEEFEMDIQDTRKETAAFFEDLALTNPSDSDIDESTGSHSDQDSDEDINPASNDESADIQHGQAETTSENFEDCTDDSKKDTAAFFANLATAAISDSSDDSDSEGSEFSTLIKNEEQDPKSDDAVSIESSSDSDESSVSEPLKEAKDGPNVNDDYSSSSSYSSKMSHVFSKSEISDVSSIKSSSSSEFESDTDSDSDSSSDSESETDSDSSSDSDGNSNALNRIFSRVEANDGSVFDSDSESESDSDESTSASKPLAANEQNASAVVSLASKPAASVPLIQKEPIPITISRNGSQSESDCDNSSTAASIPLAQNEQIPSTIASPHSESESQSNSKESLTAWKPLTKSQPTPKTIASPSSTSEFDLEDGSIAYNPLLKNEPSSGAIDSLDLGESKSDSDDISTVSKPLIKPEPSSNDIGTLDFRESESHSGYSSASSTPGSHLELQESQFDADDILTGSKSLSKNEPSSNVIDIRQIEESDSHSERSSIFSNGTMSKIAEASASASPREVVESEVDSDDGSTNSKAAMSNQSKASAIGSRDLDQSEFCSDESSIDSKAAMSNTSNASNSGTGYTDKSESDPHCDTFTNASKTSTSDESKASAIDDHDSEVGLESDFDTGPQPLVIESETRVINIQESDAGPQSCNIDIQESDSSSEPDSDGSFGESKDRFEDEKTDSARVENADNFDNRSSLHSNSHHTFFVGYVEEEGNDDDEKKDNDESIPEDTQAINANNHHSFDSESNLEPYQMPNIIENGSTNSPKEFDDPLNDDEHADSYYPDLEANINIVDAINSFGNSNLSKKNDVGSIDDPEAFFENISKGRKSLGSQTSQPDLPGGPKANGNGNGPIDDPESFFSRIAEARERNGSKHSKSGSQDSPKIKGSSGSIVDDPEAFFANISKAQNKGGSKNSEPNSDGSSGGSKSYESGKGAIDDPEAFFANISKARGSPGSRNSEPNSDGSSKANAEEEPIEDPEVFLASILQTEERRGSRISKGHLVDIPEDNFQDEYLGDSYEAYLSGLSDRMLSDDVPKTEIQQDCFNADQSDELNVSYYSERDSVNFLHEQMKEIGLSPTVIVHKRDDALGTSGRSFLGISGRSSLGGDSYLEDLLMQREAREDDHREEIMEVALERYDTMEEPKSEQDFLAILEKVTKEKQEEFAQRDLMQDKLISRELELRQNPSKREPYSVKEPKSPIIPNDDEKYPEIDKSLGKSLFAATSKPDEKNSKAVRKKKKKEKASKPSKESRPKKRNRKKSEKGATKRNSSKRRDSTERERKKKDALPRVVETVPEASVREKERSKRTSSTRRRDGSHRDRKKKTALPREVEPDIHNNIISNEPARKKGSTRRSSASRKNITLPRVVKSNPPPEDSSSSSDSSRSQFSISGFDDEYYYDEERAMMDREALRLLQQEAQVSRQEFSLTKKRMLASSCMCCLAFGLLLVFILDPLQKRSLK